MDHTRLHLVGALALLAVTIGLGEKLLIGDEPPVKTVTVAEITGKTAPKPAAKPAKLAGKPAKKAAEKAATGDANQEKLIREQSIYIPYEKLRKVFEKEGRGVFLPYQKFQELWQAAQEKTPAAAPAAGGQPDHRAGQ